MSTTERLQAPVAVPADDPARPPLVSVVIPCLNEAETIAECVTRARDALQSNNLHGEVLVADNGSSDGSPDLAAEAGARIVHEPRRGYGSAYLAGFGDSEEHPPLSFRWSGPIGNVHAPPVTRGGAGRLLLRYGRFTG